jgi:hypothetical protein
VQVISPTPDYQSWTDASVLLGRAISDLPTRRQAPYTAWRRRQSRTAENHPEDFADIVANVTVFADLRATDTAQGRTWYPDDKA